MSKLLAYTINGQKIGVDITSWDNIILSGHTAFIAIADTGSTPTNYTDISSVNNWNNFGQPAGLTDVQVKNEIIKLIPGTPTADQYNILANYMNVGINSMTKIGTTAILGSTLTSSTALTGVTDNKLSLTGGTISGDLKTTGAICGINGTLNIGGYLNVGGSAAIGGNTTMGGNLAMGGRLCAVGVCITSTPPAGTIQQPTLFWDSVSKAIDAKQLTGGSDQYIYKECTTCCSSISTTCIKYLSYTGSTAAGRYQIDFNAQLGQATCGACVLSAFKVDGATWGCVYLQRECIAGFVAERSMSRDVTLTAGTHCMEVYFWQGGGTGCATMASVRAKRIC